MLKRYTTDGVPERGFFRASFAVEPQIFKSFTSRLISLNPFGNGDKEPAKQA
jgi:hypothetical protein